MFDLSKKDYNTYLLLNLINNYGPISRTQLCDTTELRAATISDITKELIEKGLVKSEGFASSGSGRGRNQILLTINDDYLCAIGVSIEVNDITFIVSTLKGNILKKIIKNIVSFSSIDQIMNLIIDILTDLISEFSEKRILGIGVGDPGLVDITGEYSVFSSQLKLWSNIPLKSRLEKALKLPVRLEVNDRLKALGEKKYGLANNVKDFICVQLGEGIGASIISNGSLIRGHNGTSGEMGHTYVTSNNNICICGSYGCLETLSSLNVIISKTKEAISSGVYSKIRDFAIDVNNISFEDIKKAIELNDKLCLNIIHEAAKYIGLAVSNMVNLVNPQLIIFQGAMCDFGEPFLSVIKQTVYSNSLSLATSDLEFKVSELRDLSAPLGAVTMIIDHFFMAENFNLIYPKISGSLEDNFAKLI